MILFVIYFSFVWCQGEVYDLLPDCLASDNTTVPKTTCSDYPCNCFLCYKLLLNPLVNGSTFCLFATNDTMTIGNTTWICPKYSVHALENCATSHRVENAVLIGVVGTIFGCILIVGLWRFFIYLRDRRRLYAEFVPI